MSQVKKHPGAILCVDNNFFQQHVEFSEEGIVDFNFGRFLQEAQSAISWRERDAVEKNTNFRQIIPYIVVRQVDAENVTRYYPYRRTKQVGEQRLAGKVSLGYGGHIDLADCRVANGNTIDLSATILAGLQREFAEEIKLSSEDQGKQIPMNSLDKFIYTTETEVDAVHVGIVIAVDLPADVTLQAREDELKDMPLMTAEELLQQDLEVWSRLFLENITGATLPDIKFGANPKDPSVQLEYISIGNVIVEETTADDLAVKVTEIENTLKTLRKYRNTLVALQEQVVQRAASTISVAETIPETVTEQPAQESDEKADDIGETIPVNEAVEVQS